MVLATTWGSQPLASEISEPIVESTVLTTYVNEEAKEPPTIDRGSSQATIKRTPMVASRGSGEQKTGHLPLDKKYISVSSPYGYRKDPFTGDRAWHSGIDLAASGINKSPVYAVLNGKVTFAGSSGNYGRLVIVTHANGLTTKYAHLSAIANGITVGAKVSQGQIIGKVGSTGRSTGPHLHFEVLVNSKTVNPKPYLDKWR